MLNAHFDYVLGRARGFEPTHKRSKSPPLGFVRGMAASPSRRIVVCRRLRPLGSAHSLLWGQHFGKNSYQLFLPRYPTSPARRSHNSKGVKKAQIPPAQREPKRKRHPNGCLSFCQRAIKKTFSIKCLRDLNL